LAELPEGLALTDAPAAVHPLGYRYRDALRLYEQRGQLSRQLLGAMAHRALHGRGGHRA
jgi:hypothetical protein